LIIYRHPFKTLTCFEFTESIQNHSAASRLDIIKSMTTVDVLYRYAQHPKEDVMRALGSLREVYGIRQLRFNEAARTVRVEYDATRLTAPLVLQLLRSGGLDVVEEISLLAPAEPIAAPAPAPAPAA
jgi:hypothetical protein